MTEGWTDAEEARPAAGIDVLVTAESRNGARSVRLDWFDGARFVRSEYGKDASRVVAWAPAPAPYTGDLE